MDNKKFGNFLKELRKEQKLTQEDLAKEFIVDRGTISKWERGEYIPTSDMLLNISNYFGLTINELLAGERLNKDNKEIINQVTFNVLKEKEKKSKLIKRTFISTVIILLLLTTSFLSYYFINNYKSISVYTLSGENDNFNIDDGIMIVSKQKVYIKIGEIQTYNNDEINQIRLYYKKNNKEYEIYNNSKIETTIVNIFGNDELFKYADINYIKNNLYIEIKYNSKKEETLKIIVKKDFTNNKIINNVQENNAKVEKSVNENIPKYIEDNFKYNENENKYFKNYSNNDYMIYETYFCDSKIYIVEERNDRYTLYYEYYYKDKSFSYSKVENGKVETNFLYDFENKTCLSSKCDFEIIDKFNNDYFFWNK